MIRVEGNRDTCEGFGTCVLVAESIFDIDEDGLVLVKQELVPDDLLAVVQQAAYDCPTESISFTQDAEAG